MDAWNDTLGNFGKRLLAVARRRLRRPDVQNAPDYVQDVLMEAHRRMDLLRHLTPEQTFAWLLTALRLKTAGAARAERCAKRDRCRQCRLDEVEPHELAEDGNPPDELAANCELAERLSEAVRDITDEQRVVVTLRFHDCWTLDDIAAHLGITRPSVSGLLRRGLCRLASDPVLCAAMVDGGK
jgi:RNA polymerase sigma factor (sigma-70 family)